MRPPFRTADIRHDAQVSGPVLSRWARKQRGSYVTPDPATERLLDPAGQVVPRAALMTTRVTAEFLEWWVTLSGRTAQPL
jgi:hypothetical protein